MGWSGECMSISVTGIIGMSVIVIAGMVHCIAKDSDCISQIAIPIIIGAIFLDLFAINHQNLNLKDCVISFDVGTRRITITEKGEDVGIKDAEPYEIHIDGSDNNIEKLNMNDFVITVDEEKHWIMLTEKQKY